LYTSPPDYVRTGAELAAALEKLGESEVIAVDTEFLRERTYYPKLCLVQAAHDNYCVLFDVLAIEDLSPLWDFLCDRSRTKVFHAARQDLEVLALARGAQLGVLAAPIGGPIFDTQVAAGFMGMPAQIGYADLVAKRLHRTLEKGQSRTDWSQRPLTGAQLRYAADDVIYLAELYRNLHAHLGQTERWQWMQADAQALEDPRLYVIEPSEAWQRLRGIEQYEPEQRAVAKALAEWRERRAIAKDRPRSWMLADDVLRQMAERMPMHMTELAEIRGIPRPLVEKRGTELLELIATARTRASDESAQPAFKPTRGQIKKVTRLMDFVRQEGAKLGISPELLITRREVERLAYFGKAGSFTEGWRGPAFGHRLVELANELRAE
jgi:ribonuclease D